MVSRRAVIGGVGAALVAGLGYRIWDRGVFSGAEGEPYNAWAEWRGSEIDGNRRPLHAAILAANPHDTQPWIFEASDNGITVLADRARNLGTFDPFRREMHLGLGCAIENLVRAANVFGIATYVYPVGGKLALSPGPEPVAVAHIRLDTANPARDQFFEAIPRRHTNRGPYRPDHPIALQRLKWLSDLVNSDSVRVAFITDRGARAEMGSLIVDATQRIITDPQMSLDSYNWIRTGRSEVLAHPDGISIDASGVPPWLVMAGKMLPDQSAASTDQYWFNMTRDTHVATAPVLGIILVKDRLGMSQSIEAGRAWQRLHLGATLEGLAAQPLNQPVECIDRNQMLGSSDAFQKALVEFAQTPFWQPTFVFRMGVAEQPATPSPRRPLIEVVRG